MSGDFRPIETRYKGYVFRSKLEATWAVFLDALGEPWEYEPEGFELPGLGRYLPDFYLLDLELWLEVKGAHERAPAVHLALRKCAGVAQNKEADFRCVFGQPWAGEHWIFDIDRYGCVELMASGLRSWGRPDQVEQAAFVAAREARFDRGQTPSIPTYGAPPPLRPKHHAPPPLRAIPQPTEAGERLRAALAARKPEPVPQCEFCDIEVELHEWRSRGEMRPFIACTPCGEQVWGGNGEPYVACTQCDGITAPVMEMVEIMTCAYPDQPEYERSREHRLCPECYRRAITDLGWQPGGAGCEWFSPAIAEVPVEQ